MNKHFATDYQVIEIGLYSVQNESTPYVNLAGDMCKQFQYFEDITWPAYAATMVIQDNAENVISTMPIQGYEKVVVEVDDLTESSGDNKGRYKYEFRVWNISNRIESERKQTYTLNLISEQGLRNEGTIINKILSGNTSTVVKKLLDEYLSVPATSMDIEESVTSIKLLPTKKTPFTVVKSLLHKTISESIELKKDNKDESDSDIISDESNSESTKGTGSAGFMFFQTNRGHVFRSIDSLIANENNGFTDAQPVFHDKRTPYYWQPAKNDDPSLYRIQEVVFSTELDMIKKLRTGHYSSVMCAIDINNLTYKEQIYKLEDTWDQMQHLGSQTKLPKGQVNLSKYPTRIMSTILDNEVWNPDPKIGSVEEGGDGSHQYQDYQLNYLSQGLARSGILFNQQLTISLTGHLELCAGDKIEIMIPNQKQEGLKGDSAYDPEHSGTYLIKQVNHQFNMTDSRNVYTVLDLVRDSQGIKDQESIVK